VKVCTACEKWLPPDYLASVQGLKSAVETFKEVMVPVASLHNPALKQRHWQQMEKKMKQQLNFGEPYFTLEKVLAIKPLKHSLTITNIVQVAVGEQALAEMLDKVATLWRGVDLPVTSYKSSMDVFVMGDPEDIMTQVRIIA
jgi:dynein heavy chain